MILTNTQRRLLSVKLRFVDGEHAVEIRFDDPVPGSLTLRCAATGQEWRIGPRGGSS